MAQTEQEGADFGAWLTAEMKKAGVTPKMLVARSGVGKSSVSMYSSGERNPSRDMVERLVRGLVPPEMTGDDAEERYERMISGALRAAGFEPDLDPDLRVLVEFFEGSPPEKKEMMRDSIRLIRKLHEGGHVTPNDH
jgi:transcriptional regulator with XRE-family HTH domain